MSQIEVSYVMPRKGANARGILTFPRLRVLSGSVVAEPETRTMYSAYRKLRRQLIDSGIIARRNGVLVFTQSYTFDNASEAACVVEGGARDGYKSWRDDNGCTLFDLGHHN